jgi:hypothetical protein
MSIREELASKLAYFRRLREQPDVPAKAYDRRGWAMVKSVCGRALLPLPTQRLVDQGARSHLDHHVLLLSKAVRASCMGNHQDMKSAVIELAAHAAAWAERIETRGP